MKKVQKPNVYLACNAFWVIVFMLLTFGFQVSRVEAQGVKINNATLKPSGNIKIVVKDGDLINNGIYATASETFTFTGTQAVVVSGTASTTFANLTLNNEAGLTLENDVSISGMLEFLNGKVSTGDHLMTMGPVGTFSNTSSTGYIEGKLAHSFSAPCAKHFPIGKEGAYRPLTLKFSALTGISVVQAEQFETPLTGDLPENTTLMTTGRHWKLTQAGGSGMEYFITLDPTDYSPARPVVMLKQDEGTIGSSDATTPEYTNASPFNTFSEFGLGEVCKNPDDGGNIAGEQYSCNSFDPDEITSTELPSGNTGELDYQWQQSITGSTTGFEIIEGATGASYDPGSIAQTTWFRRLAKVSCKVDWDGYAVSNVVKMTIDVTPPWATAKNNTVELNPYGTYILEATDVLSAWGDSETSVTSIVMNPPSVSCAHLGQTIAVAVTVEDECGNPTTVYSDITVAEGMAIPDPWLNANTHTSAGGTATYSYCDSEGTFRLSATGKSTTTSDVFHFVYQEELCSDQATVIARLAEVENGGWGGVMMRENTTPGAKTILFKTRLYNPNVIIGYRTTTNKSMRNLSQVAQMIRWMKIQRNGNNFKVFTSYNGTTWQQRYSGTIYMGGCILAGIFTESVLASRTSVAWFDNVEVASGLKTGEVFTITESDPLNVEIYPNPADDLVTISITGKESEVSYQVTDIDGRLIGQSNFTGRETTLDVSNFKPGLYVIRLEIGGKMATKRLVVM